MSIDVMTRVWKHSEQRGGALLVLIALADFADDDGYCWPAVPTIAAKARMTERNARYVLRGLEDAGEISITPGGGRYGTSGYYIRTGAEIAGGQNLPGAKRRTKGAKCDTERGQPIAPKPSGLTIIEPSVLREGANGAPSAPPVHPAPITSSHPNGMAVSHAIAQPTSQAKAGGRESSAAQPADVPGTRVPEPVVAKAPPAWAPFYEAVSETLGGMRVVKAGTGAPLAWVGELARIAGAHVNGSGPVGAAALWREFTESRDWQFAGSKPTGFPAAFGKWVGARRPEVNAYAHIPVVQHNPEWVEGDPLPF